jgi:hypothetical protein
VLLPGNDDEVHPLADCAICLHLNETPRLTTGTVGLLTASERIVGEAIERIGEIGPESHVVVYACPEHVVDIYRGRVDGVRMAWRLTEAPGNTPLTLNPRRNHEVASSSPA